MIHLDSFILVSASFTSHLCGKIYPLIIAAQSQYSMQMNVSGSATGTGKSFWQSVWMKVFEGEVKTTLNGITEAQAYQRLANGENIYGNKTFNYA